MTFLFPGLNMGAPSAVVRVGSPRWYCCHPERSEGSAVSRTFPAVLLKAIRPGSSKNLNVQTMRQTVLGPWSELEGGVHPKRRSAPKSSMRQSRCHPARREGSAFWPPSSYCCSSGCPDRPLIGGPEAFLHDDARIINRLLTSPDSAGMTVANDCALR